MQSNEPDGITNPEYLKKLDEFESWLLTQPEVADVSTISDVIKTLHKNMNGGLDEYYAIPDNKALIAQYLLLYEFSVPYGMDLKNQMTADKSDSRILIRTNNSTSMESVAFNARVDEWVNKNIEKFGGDKNNITIFGESAGGHNVFALLSSPLAKGLFHKAISQSGATNTFDLEEASK